MLEEHARPLLQKIAIDPVAKFIPNFISPTIITIFSGLLGVLVPILTAFNHIISAIIALLFSGYLDILDGSVARLRNQTTPLGTTLDIITDRLVEFCAVLAIYLVYPPARGTLCLAILGSFYICITSFLIVGIFSENESEKNFHYNPGLIERAETFVFIVAILLFPWLFTLLGSLLVILVVLTSILHIHSFIKQNMLQS